MTLAYILTPELRKKLKDPFGSLIQGSPDQTMVKMKGLVESEKPSRIISVGDVVSRNLHLYNLHPQVTIIDNISQRDQPMPQEEGVEKTVYVENPQGTITKEAIIAIEDALESGEHTHIVVRGEEDLLTLIAVLYAPETAFVVYGQPHSGIVVIRATSEKKAQVKEYLKAMKSSKS
jgi:GTP-dependent dephospho-CoA kinase